MDRPCSYSVHLCHRYVLMTVACDIPGSASSLTTFFHICQHVVPLHPVSSIPSILLPSSSHFTYLPSLPFPPSIPPSLSSPPPDVCVAKPDEKSVLTYVSLIKAQFSVMPPGPKLASDHFHRHQSLLSLHLCVYVIHRARAVAVT